MRYKVTHTTTYSYSEPVSIGHNEVHLVPRDTPRQTCLAHRLTIRPHPSASSRLTDYFGNHVTLFSIQQEHRKLVVASTSQIELRPLAAPPFESTPAWDDLPQRISDDRSPAGLDVIQFVYDSSLVPLSAELAEYARPSFPAGRPLLEGVRDLTARIHKEFRYDAQATTVNTPLDKVLQGRRGVCQDFAHLEIGCLRSLGLPARYVSGYIRTTPPPGQPRLVGADASHAWVGVFCPGIGWIDFDPTNNSIPGTDHIHIAWGRDYADVCPIKGVVTGGGQHALIVSVDVEPVESELDE